MTATTRILACLAILAASRSAPAVPILEVEAPDGSPVVGSSFEIDVSIADLAGEFVGAYDVTLAFDAAVLDPAGVAFGTLLDGPADSLQGSLAGTGSLDVFEISLGLLLGQDGFSPFTLFSVTFDVIGPGESAIDLGVNAIGGFFGESLAVRTAGTSVTAVPATPVPEPGTAALLLVGLFLLASRTSRRGRPRLSPAREPG